ncbi:hypothetical protein HMPREF1624_05855 [Sporothrix schenckii ATCC 58251]|uniref:Zn(2)-C6 fungal-type domain-containing protein n=1 Tax=Sporothrix schenckii (strain ATCC 58251 / de Perez 2211183) TaxID=1391915 RepID=U7PSF2_SPOS1|nr:hypothetical protein HMPREF1624_05855 [Sporothrix schenckii ATCC 58251]
MESVSCIICRRRKIKCDRRPITCANCAKFGAPCSYREAPSASSTATSASEPGLGAHHNHRGGALSSTATTTQAGLQRRRILRSCTACKRAKAKCSGGISCARCIRRGVACVYEGSRGDASVSSTTTTTTTTLADQVLPLAPAPAPAVAPEIMYRSAANDSGIAGDPSDTFPSPDSAGLVTPLPVTVSSSTLPSQPSHHPAGVSAIPDWLLAPGLPPMDRLRGLLATYFARIYPLRCLGFLHMPTFFERLRDPQSVYADEYGLINAMCALAAPFHCVDRAGVATGTSPTSTTAPTRFYDAGSGWAATAMQRIFHHLGTPDVESLMTEMLVHEYYLRNGEYAKAFMLSGIVARHVQVLQLNLEHDHDLPSQQRARGAGGGGAETISWSNKECRRRLVWCCFLQDAFMECGIDQLRFVNPADIQVQLPCTEELFVRNKPCVTEMLTPGQLLPFVDPTTAGTAAHNLDLRAYYIRAMAVRAKILKYVKNLRGDVPWSPDPRVSRFASLDRELRALEASVPDELRMTPENTSVFRWSGGWSGASGSGGLGLYFGLHILLAQTFNDLYRVGVANLVFPHHATQWIRAHAPLDFLLRCHRMCSSKAVVIATLLEELWQTNRLSLVDTPYAMHAQVCSSVLVMTISSWQALLSSSRGRRGGVDDRGSAADGCDGVDVPDGADSLGNGNGESNGSNDPLVVPAFLPEHRHLLQSNVTVLDFLRRYIKADLYYESAKQALRRFEELEARGSRSTSSAEDTAGTAASSAATESSQFSLEYILNPLGVYPMARKQARNRHEPEANVAASVSKADTSTSAQHARDETSTQMAQNTHQQHTQNSPNVPGSDNAPGSMMPYAYPPRQPTYADIPPTMLPPGQHVVQHEQVQPALPQLPEQAIAGGLDTADATQFSLFQMWDWESEVPGMDNMGYPTFLDTFPVASH